MAMDMARNTVTAKATDTGMGMDMDMKPNKKNNTTLSLLYPVHRTHITLYFNQIII